MKKNIKTNLKLAGVCATAMMTLSGCIAGHTNVIESVSFDKLLVKDVIDGEERIIELGKYYNKHMGDGFKYYCVGDTIVVVEFRARPGYQYEKRIPIWATPKGGEYGIMVNRDSLEQRSYREYEQRQQPQFDSLKCAIIRESQEKQR